MAQKAANKLTGKQSATEADLPLSVEDMNLFYAAASTDTKYLEPVLKATASTNTTLCNEYNIFFILDKLKPTADGLDHIPPGFFVSWPQSAQGGLPASSTCHSTLQPSLSNGGSHASAR